MIVNKYAKEIKKTNPDFSIILGNEIYLTETRDKGQKYYHFLLLAKDEIGYTGLKELSSIAWYNSYRDKMERVPLLKSELTEVMKKYKGHIIASTACLAGELPSNIIDYKEARNLGDYESAKFYLDNILSFLDFCEETFGKDDFYVEIQPADSEDQIIVNKGIVNLSKIRDLKIIVTTDSHYLRPEDASIHRSYLNSKDGEREVDAFYKYTYLMTTEEIIEILKKHLDEEDIYTALKNTNEIRNKVEFYSLQKKQQVIEEPVSTTFTIPEEELIDYPTLNKMRESTNPQEKYWVNECVTALKEKNLFNETYLSRLEEEADIKMYIGNQLDTCIFAYPNTLQHNIDLFWECGSTIGAGRGSACAGLNHYLLGITQLDPIKYDLPFFRYLNKKRVELPDIDVDLCPSRREKIFEKIREKRGELGLIQVVTFGTETTKSAILAACRGYRSPDYPTGIDVDIAQYFTGLIPSERGFLWPISDVVKGNKEKCRKPVKEFIKEVEKYPGLLKIIVSIEGLVNKRGIHASGVIFFDEGQIYNTAAIMRAPNGNLVTQWDLHDQEDAGSTKYDFLLTEVQDKIRETIQLLQEDGVIEKDLSLREVYNKYLHPDVLPIDNPEIWKNLAEGNVLNCFQFDSPVGQQAARKIKPTTPFEMADANSLMRLMNSEKGGINPLDKYVMFKEDISLWYKEMTENGITPEEQKTLEPHFLPSYGVPPSQEQMMLILMDKNICGFSLEEANAARKIVGKKLMDKIPELKEKILKKAKNSRLGDYVWQYGIAPQLGYSFSKIHSLGYSFIGIQTLVLATCFNSIYWNTACLIVNSGSVDIESEKNNSTDYGKNAKAIGEIKEHGIEVSLVDINKSTYKFTADVKNNKIIFGLKGLLNVGDDVIKQIIANRPYNNFYDFLHKTNISKSAILSLIKGGAFDCFGERKFLMALYIWDKCGKKQVLNLRNMGSLIKHNLIDFSLSPIVSIYEFTRYIRKELPKTGDMYILDDRATNFMTSLESEDLDNFLEIHSDKYLLSIKAWDKFYNKKMDIIRDWIKDNQQELLQRLNQIIFLEFWNKSAKGTYSDWEMEALCFYYHDHKLKNVNKEKYGLIDFKDLPREPMTYRAGKYELKQLFTICGTCIDKNKTKSTVTLLTTNEVITVKFRKEYFSLFDKRISAYGADGKKHIIENSWFNRGNMIMVQGFRSGDDFIVKKYGRSPGHQLYKISQVYDNGDINITSERNYGESEDDVE